MIGSSPVKSGQSSASDADESHPRLPHPTRDRVRECVGRRAGAHRIRPRAALGRPGFSPSWSFPMSSNPLATALVAPFEHLRMTDVEAVGGKNASLGEMISQLAASGVRVPGGFATTAHAFREFLRHGGLTERISARLLRLNVDDVTALAEAGAEIRGWIAAAALPSALESAARSAFAALPSGDDNASYAVRSSATAEDLPDASFAGQQETFLNVSGIDDVLHRMKEVFASLYNDRAISYRVHKGFAHTDVALSAGVQRMVRSDIGAVVVMFTTDTESGFK